MFLGKSPADRNWDLCPVARDFGHEAVSDEADPTTRPFSVATLRAACRHLSLSLRLRSNPEVSSTGRSSQAARGEASCFSFF